MHSAEGSVIAKRDAERKLKKKNQLKKGSVFTNEVATNDEISRLDERDNDLVLNDILSVTITISKFSNLIGHQQA